MIDADDRRKELPPAPAFKAGFYYEVQSDSKVSTRG